MKSMTINDEQIQNIVELCFQGLNVECTGNNEIEPTSENNDIDARLMDTEDLLKLWYSLTGEDEIVVIK